MFGSSVRILIIDDGKTTRLQLRRYLSELGYDNVVEAIDGNDAIKKMVLSQNMQKPIQLVISDWEMPGLSGLELFRMIRQSPQWQDVPFLFVTSHARLQDVYTAAAAGIEHYLVKPVEKEKLRLKIESLYNRSLSKFAQKAAELFYTSQQPEKKKKSG